MSEGWRDKRFIALCATAIVVVLVVIWGVSALQHRGKTGYNLVVLPNDSTVTLDGKKIKPGKIYVTAGKHKLVAERELFDTVTLDFEAPKLSNKENINLLPKATSLQALKWLQDHQAIAEAREEILGKESAKDQKRISDQYPYLSQLPHETLNFRVDYQQTDGGPTFQVKLFAILNRPSDFPQYQQDLQTYKKEALDYMKSIGINTDGATIQYTPDPEKL